MKNPVGKELVRKRSPTFIALLDLQIGAFNCYQQRSWEGKFEAILLFVSGNHLVCFYIWNIFRIKPIIQSGLSSRAKHGGTDFSAFSGSIKDLTTVPGFCNHLGPPNLINFAPALVFLSVLNIYSFAIEFGGCICYFWSKWISRAKFLTFPWDDRLRRGWIACNMQWLFMFFWMKNLH